MTVKLNPLADRVVVKPLEEQEQKKGGEPKKSASLDGPTGYSLSAELIGVAILFLPFVARLHRWRRGGRRK